LPGGIKLKADVFWIHGVRHDEASDQLFVIDHMRVRLYWKDLQGNDKIWDFLTPEFREDYPDYDGILSTTLTGLEGFISEAKHKGLIDPSDEIPESDIRQGYEGQKVAREACVRNGKHLPWNKFLDA
jgi:hypothetical protein